MAGAGPPPRTFLPMLVAVGIGASACGRPADAPLDVLIIALDTVRWDHTGLADPTSGRTPNLVAFSKLPGATVFDHAYTDAAWSQPAYVSLMTGQQAITHGVGFQRSAMRDGQATLASMLQANGYETRAYVSGPHLDPITGLDRGFDQYNHSLDQRTIGVQVGPALDWLMGPREGDKPRFGFIHGYDAHSPYGAPALISDPLQPEGVPLEETCSVPSFRCFPPGQMNRTGDALAPEHQARLDGAYEAAVMYADYHLGRILHDLDSSGALDHTLVVVLSDHGEMLGETGGLGHDDGYDDRVYHVPLVVYAPSEKPAHTVSRVVSLSDVVPTLAARLDVVAPNGTDGRVVGELLGPTQESEPHPHRGASLCCYYVRDGEDAAWAKHGVTPLSWTLLTGSNTAEPAETVSHLRTAFGDWPAVLENVDDVNHEAGRRNPALKRALQEAGYWRQEDK